MYVSRRVKSGVMEFLTAGKGMGKMECLEEKMKQTVLISFLK